MTSSAEHIPPPPLEPVPEAVKKADSSLGGGKVPMPVIGEDGKAKVVMAKATSGVFRRGGSVTRPGSVTGGRAAGAAFGLGYDPQHQRRGHLVRRSGWSIVVDAWVEMEEGRKVEEKG